MAESNAAGKTGGLFTKKTRVPIVQINRGEILPFCLRNPAGDLSWRMLRNRECGRGRGETVYSSGDGALNVLLRTDIDEESCMFSFSIRLTALKTTAYTLSGVKIADIPLPKQEGETKLWAASGGYSYDSLHDVKSFPPSMLRDEIYPIPRGTGKTIHSNMSGRSADENLPIWILQIDDDGGVWFGPEWSGSWEMTVSHEDRGVRVTLGLPSMNFRMIQGEEIDLPPFIIGEYRGDLWNGSNALRRTIRDKLTPKLSAAPVHPQVVFQGFGGIEPYQDEKYFIREARIAAELGVENFVFDAGWNHAPYARVKDESGKELEELKPWYQCLGNWIPSTERFPAGMDAYGARVRSLGMRFGLWCEPRVSPGTPDHEEYPDILLKYKEDSMHMGGTLFHKQYFVDLGKKRGEDYFVGIVERFVEEYHANWLWFDYNTNPDPRSLYWDEVEEPDRRGLAELRFYRGLYNYFERLMAKYPDLWIESCASGGRIIDLGMIKRSHSIWISDFTAYYNQVLDVDICRNMRSGIGKFLPAVYIQNAVFIPQTIRESAEPYDLYNYLSHFLGDLQFGQGLPEWKEKDIKFAIYAVAKYKAYRRYLEEDFYQLVPIPKDKTGWDGWQFDDPKTDSGILVLFRMADCEEPSFKIPVHRIAAYKRYTFDVVLGNGTVSVTDNDLSARLENKFDAMLVHYSMS